MKAADLDIAETAYCGECRQLRLIDEVLEETSIGDTTIHGAPKGTIRRHVTLLGCPHVVNVVSRFVERR